VSLRYFNVFGPRQALDDQYAVVIPKFISCILNGAQPPVFGTGKQSRDFTYVEDVVQANILSAVTPGVTCEIFNVANGKNQSVLELVFLLDKILGKNIKPLLLPKRAGDVFKTLADVSRAKKIIGFKSRFTFEEGLRKTVDWFRTH
jgi:UDP-glucose 4-epimerase